MSFLRKFIFFISAFACLQSINYAQEKSLSGQLKEALQKKYASLSILVRNIADFQPERSMPGNNGFYIENFRIKLSGELDDNFGYSLETKMVNSPAILDAKLYYKFSPGFRLDFGLFKLPFSGEYLVSEGDIDFVYRSQMVNALNIGKQVGIMISGETGNKLLTYSAGMFNGNTGASGNDNDKFLYVGRIVLEPPGTSSKENVLQIGLNAAQSIDKSVKIMGRYFEGNRLLLGGDINLAADNFRFYSETLWGRLKSITGITTNPFGYQITAGYAFSKSSQLFARWDSFKEDTGYPFNNLAAVGIDIIPAEFFKFQLNYVIPANDGKFKHHQLLINSQLSF